MEGWGAPSLCLCQTAPYQMHCCNSRTKVLLKHIHGVPSLTQSEVVPPSLRSGPKQRITILPPLDCGGARR